MAVPYYSNDLTEISLGEVLGTWVEHSTWKAGGIPAVETDYFIQGASCIAQAVGAGFCGIVYNNVTGITLNADDAVIGWYYFGAPNNIQTETSSGRSVLIGSSQANTFGWIIRGSDTYQYGGWECIPVCRSVTPEITGGSPTSTNQWFGSLANVVSTLKGAPHGIDGLRYGRGEMRLSNGEVGNQCTFSGFATSADYVSNRWGIFQSISGGYQWFGLMTLGYGTSAINFYDENKNIVIANTRKVTSGFNRIDMREATSSIGWKNINFTALGTVSRGALSAIDNATIQMTGCVFTDMDTFSLQSNSTIYSTTMNRCASVYQSGATLNGCLFDNTRDSRSILSDNPGLISNTSFISDGSNHALEIPTLGASAAYVLTGLTYSNYVAGGTGVSGTSGNESIYNNSGQHVKLTIDGGDVPSYRNGSGATTQIVTGQRTLTLTGIVSGSEVRIFDQSGPPPTELGGSESSDTTFQYSYTYSASTYVDIVVYKVDYEYYRVEDYLLLDANSSLPIAQQIDRQYQNP